MKIADAALLAGLQEFLREPQTLEYLTDALSAKLNVLIDDRPRLRAMKVAERETLQHKLAHLIAAIEDGAGTTALVGAMRSREAGLARLDAELDMLDEPLRDRLAVMPTWVRQQVTDVATLLSAAPERAKQEFQRLGVRYTVSIVLDEGPRPFLRAVGTTVFRAFWRGQGRLYYCRWIGPAVGTVKQDGGPIVNAEGLWDLRLCRDRRCRADGNAPDAAWDGTTVAEDELAARREAERGVQAAR